MTTEKPAHEAGGSPIASFWMGGFEGADHLDAAGHPLDMASANDHLAQLDADHARAAALGLRSVRESIGWRLAEPSPGVYDLSRAQRIATSARRHGLQVVWTLMHYGTPSDLSVFDDALMPRFVSFAREAARVLAPLGGRPPVFNLVNEIGYLAWAVSQPGLMCATAGLRPPAGTTASMASTANDVDASVNAESTLESGYAVKRRLVRATIDATAAILEMIPDARFLQVEPLVHVEPPRDRPDLAGLARQVCDYQWQVWDLLSGRLEPELGGHEGALDLVGVNYYHSGQWEVLTENRLDWRVDPRRLPFSALLHDAWARYRRPIVVAETGHVGEGRATWFHEIADEARTARREGVPIHGLCLYPLIDRPDWNDASRWHHSGLWDVDRRTVAPAVPGGTPTFRRVVCTEYAGALQRWQAALDGDEAATPARDCLVVFSHLRWGSGDQRPQQLATHLARHYRVVYVEPPLANAGEAQLERIAIGPAIDLLVPRTPIGATGVDHDLLSQGVDNDNLLSQIGPLLADALRARSGTGRCIAWFGTPMALPLMGALPRSSVVVYDIGDDAGAAPGAGAAARALRRAREFALLQRADLVLTASTPRLAAPHPRAHWLPNAVDPAHFAPELLDPGCAHAFDVRALQHALPTPRLGFLGTVDDRFDATLLAAVADARPGWQFVIVGPVVNRDPAALPQRPNIAWIGAQSYLRMPHWVASWDVCLLPRVRGDASARACPVELFAYMAGGKPIVGTPTATLGELHGDTVRTASTPAEFIAACSAALVEQGPARVQRQVAMLATVRRHSWLRTAAEVHRLLQAIIESAPEGAESSTSGSEGVRPVAASNDARDVSHTLHERSSTLRRSAT